MENGEFGPINLYQQESLQLLIELEQTAEDLLLKYHEKIVFLGTSAGILLYPNPSNKSSVYQISKHYYSDDTDLLAQDQSMSLDIVETRVAKYIDRPGKPYSVMQVYEPRNGRLIVDSYKVVNGKTDDRPFKPGTILLNSEIRELIDDLKSAQTFVPISHEVTEETNGVKKFLRMLGRFSFKKSQSRE